MAYTKTRTMDCGRWTMDDGRWTMNDGPFHGHAINNFVTSRIEHTPYETSIFYFLFLQLRHAINHLLASSSRNIDFDWPRSPFYLSTRHLSLRSCVTKKDHFERSISHFVTCQLRNYFLLVQLCHAIPLTSHTVATRYNEVPRYRKKRSLQRGLRYSEDPVKTNYLVNSKNIRYSVVI